MGRGGGTCSFKVVFPGFVSYLVYCHAIFHYYTRTRSMSGESVPSDTVTYDLQ